MFSNGPVPRFCFSFELFSKTVQLFLFSCIPVANEVSPGLGFDHWRTSGPNTVCAQCFPFRAGETMSLFSLCFCCFCWDGRKRDFVCKVWCPSQCPHIVAFYITVQFLSEFSVPLGTHSLLWRSRQHNAPYGAGGCHTSSLCWVFLLFILGALLGSGTCVKGAPHVIFCRMAI